MRLANVLIMATLLPLPVFAYQSDHYKAYEEKLESCVLAERNKPEIIPSTLRGFPREAIVIGISYIKDKRLVECSAKEELYSLVKSLEEGSTDYEVLKNQYLSIYLLEKEKPYLGIPSELKMEIETVLDNRNLEINLLSLFDKVD